MKERFRLDRRLSADTHLVCDLPLCRVLLMDDSRFLWIVLVPRRHGVTELFELASSDRARLMDEIDRSAKALKKLARADKINIGALGNKVAQLHIHVVARMKNDPAWPDPVWGHGAALAYEPSVRDGLTKTLRRVLSICAG
ncbi:MAG: HIT domain-containing protein [Alphaproteobacteria bacterium]|nr:HIT domain-containing protein [Alphaproteobacteria bacterium]